MIHDIDEMLQRMLSAELAKIPGCPLNDPSQITFDPPQIAESRQDNKPRINLYLHDIHENLQLRDEGFHLTRSANESTVGIKRAPARLDLGYLVTAYAGDEARIEHRLLSDTLSVLMRHMAAPPQYMTGLLEGLGVNAVPMSVAQPDHRANTDPPSLWQSLGGRLRPALSLVVTAPFDPFETKWTKVVREAVFGLGIGTPPNGPRRPLDMHDVRVSAAGVAMDPEKDTPIPEVAACIVGREETTRSDARGFFYFLNLPAGPHAIRLEKPGYQSQEVTVVAPPLGRPDQLEPVVVAMPLMSDALRAEAETERVSRQINAPELVEAGRVYQVSLTGTLRLPDGRPAAYIPVRVGKQRTTTDGDGVYSFLNLPPGDDPLIAEMPGHGDIALGAANSSGGATRTLALAAVEPAPDSAIIEKAKGSARKKE